MKDKYKLFNDMKIDDSDYKNHSLSEDDKGNIFKSVNAKIKKQDTIKTNKYKKLAVASILCICVSSIILSNDKVWAMVENIGQQIEQLLGKPTQEYDGFKVSVNQSVEDSNLKVNLTEALLNDGEIILSLGVDRSNFDNTKYKKAFYSDPYFNFRSPTIYIDDLKFAKSGSWGGHESRNGKVQEFIHAYSLSDIDNTGDNIPDIDDFEILDSIDPNKDYEVKIVFDELTLLQVGKIPFLMKHKFDTVDGNWEFKFKVNGKNMQGKTQVFNINKKITVKNNIGSGDILIDSLRVSPVSIRLKYRTVQSKELIESIDPYNISNSLGLELFDQDGNNISGGGGGSSEDLITFDCDMSAVINNYKDLKSIKIIPYIYSTKKDFNFSSQNKQILFEDKAIEIKLNK